LRGGDHQASKRGVIGEGEHGGSWLFELSSQHFGVAVVAEVVDVGRTIEPHVRRASLAASVAQLPNGGMGWV
jgi:hypothetical protein